MLELVKFFFNDVWQYIFGGMSENLGFLKSKKCDFFEITDNEFRFLARISREHDSKNYQVFVSGVIRGALVNLGVEPSPTVDINLKTDGGRAYPALQVAIRCGSQRRRK